MHLKYCSMYNARMREGIVQIRVCRSCGLRYPLTDERAFGIRCPVCLGETRLAAQRKANFEASPIQQHTKKEKWGGIAVLLDNIRSAGNVGSILRSAEGFGFSRAYLCGITPTPENNAVKKTALGAEESVTWSYHKDAVKLAKGLRTKGWDIVSLEEGKNASNIADARRELDLARQTVLIVGNEITGVDASLLELCKRIYYIPMRGEKKSFNVAVAFGIAAYAFRATG
jgi:23S rRNA (guanosine2251-2'-O)-methyltransferase